MASATMSKADFEALAAFRYRLRRFLRFSEEITRRNGVTPLQYQLMLQIKGFPDRDWATITELAERLQAKHHGVVALVSRCEEAGLVQRGTSPSDQRRVEVRLTAEGEQRLERLARLHRDELRSARADFSGTGLVDDAGRDDDPREPPCPRAQASIRPPSMPSSSRSRMR